MLLFLYIINHFIAIYLLLLFTFKKTCYNSYINYKNMENRIMIQERKNFILEELNKKGIVRVDNLSSLLNTSDVTIRRDLKQLEDEGLLKRIYGGAVKKSNTVFEPQVSKLLTENIDQKKQIAKYAYSLLEDSDAISIDGSTTGYYLAKQIRKDGGKKLTVVTNSILISYELMGLTYIDLYTVGGQVPANSWAARSERAEKDFKAFCVDKAFIGVNGIDFNIGITTPDIYETQIKRAMMSVSKQTYILADSTKFSHTYFSYICSPAEANAIITDSQVSPRIIAEAESRKITLLVADDSENL